MINIYLPIHPSHWICRAPGREDHWRILYKHPVSGLRYLKCPVCDNDEIVEWLARYDPNQLELTEYDRLLLLAMNILF